MKLFTLKVDFPDPRAYQYIVNCSGDDATLKEDFKFSVFFKVCVNTKPICAER